MFGIINYEVFLLTGILLNLIPGADTMYIIGESIAQGRKAGVYSVFGIIIRLDVFIPRGFSNRQADRLHIISTRLILEIETATSKDKKIKS
ncbi:hypothetical protein ASL14_19875 [Paenibacillus sp. IHB B 3084]|nr:hypothetical protein ASL14_19875 [Paenibacillus sp. IHB B 3084]